MAKYNRVPINIVDGIDAPAANPAWTDVPHRAKKAIVSIISASSDMDFTCEVSLDNGTSKSVLDGVVSSATGTKVAAFSEAHNGKAVIFDVWGFNQIRFPVTTLADEDLTLKLVWVF